MRRAVDTVTLQRGGHKTGRGRDSEASWSEGSNTHLLPFALQLIYLHLLPRLVIILALSSFALLLQVTAQRQDTARVSPTTAHT